MQAVALQGSVCLGGHLARPGIAPHGGRVRWAISTREPTTVRRAAKPNSIVLRGSRHTTGRSTWRLRPSCAAKGGGGGDTVENVVNEGLQAFDRNQYKRAIEAFNTAEGMNPTDTELQAICYNRACAHTKLGDLPAACEDLKRAVNDYGVKYKTVIADNDLAKLRDSPVFDEISNELKGASTEAQMIRIRTEAKAPFRLARLVLFSGGAFAAFVALFTTLPALLQAVSLDEAEGISKQLTNLGVNAGVLVALVFFILRDFAEREKQEATMERLEALGKLQVQKETSGRTVALSRLRGINRPIIIAGSSTHVKQALREAQGFKAEFETRGIVIVPVVLNDAETLAAQAKLEALKKGFGEESLKAKAADDAENGTSAPAAAPAPTLKGSSANKGLRLLPVEVERWQEWVDVQMALAGVEKRENVYVTLGLDGSVVASGVGLPRWAATCQELEPLDSTRTKISQV